MTRARLDQIVVEAVLRIGNLESDELYSKIVREAVVRGIEAEREACAEIAEAWVNPKATILNEMQMVAAKIARKIRARSQLPPIVD